MLPVRGAQLYTVRGAAGLALPVASAVGSPSVSAEVVQRFQKDILVAGLLVLVAPLAGYAGGLQAQQAMISATVLDEHLEPIVTDTRGSLTGTNQAPAAVPSLAISGRAFHPFPMNRVVRSNDVWRFTFQNDDPANAMTLAAVVLYLEQLR